VVRSCWPGTACNIQEPSQYTNHAIACFLALQETELNNGFVLYMTGSRWYTQVVLYTRSSLLGRFELLRRASILRYLYVPQSVVNPASTASKPATIVTYALRYPCRESQRLLGRYRPCPLFYGLHHSPIRPRVRSPCFKQVHFDSSRCFKTKKLLHNFSSTPGYVILLFLYKPC
jgi:hypothetical protein